MEYFFQQKNWLHYLVVGKVTSWEFWQVILDDGMC